MGTKLISIIIILLGLTFNSFSQGADSIFLIQDLNKIEWRGSVVRSVTNVFEYEGEAYLIKYEFYPDAHSITYTVFPPPPPHYSANVYVYKNERCIYKGEGTYSDNGCCTYPIEHIKKALNQK